MTPQNFRIARAVLNWSQADLAAAAEINLKSVCYWEAKDGSKVQHAPAGAHPKMVAAITGAGVEMAETMIAWDNIDSPPQSLTA